MLRGARSPRETGQRMTVFLGEGWGGGPGPQGITVSINLSGHVTADMTSGPIGFVLVDSGLRVYPGPR